MLLIASLQGLRIAADCPTTIGVSMYKLPLPERCDSITHSSSPSQMVSLYHKVRQLGLAFPLLTAGLGMTGCSGLSNWYHNGFKVGPDYCKPAAQVADNWIDFNNPSVISSPVDDRNWWHVFNDPALNSLVQSTYQGNLDLHAQAQRVLEYRAVLAVSTGNLFPQAQYLDGFYKHAQISRNGNLPGVPLPNRAFDLFNVGPNLQWEVDVWGKYRRRIEQAEAEVDREVELYDDILSISVADTAKAYTSFRVAQEFIRLARENIAIQKGSLELAETRFREGATNEMDVTQAKSTLHATEALVPQYEADLRKANNQLCLLLGIPPRDLTTEFGEGPIPVAPTTVALGIPGELLRRRPDIRAAERAVAKASAEIGVAEADLYPQFSIDGSFSWTASQFPDMFSGKAFGGIIGPSFHWDLLNYGRITNNVQRLEARFQAAAIQYQQTVLQANKEVEDAIVSFLKAQDRAIKLQSAVESTQRSVELGLIQYREGAVDFDRIFNLQNILVRQQIDQAEARAEISLSLINVYRALRGGWQIRLGSQSGTPEIAVMGDVPVAPPTFEPDLNVPATETRHPLLESETDSSSMNDDKQEIRPVSETSRPMPEPVTDPPPQFEPDLAIPAIKVDFPVPE